MGRPSKASRARAKERRHKWQNSSYLPPEPVQPTITEPVQPTITEPVQPTIAEPVQPTITEPVQPTITEPVQASLTQYAEHPMNHAIIIILAHGCIMTSVDEYIQVPRCVVDFEKKNVTACGFLSMLDLYYRYNPNFMLGNIIKHGLKDSFPQPSDVYALREGHENFGSSNTARDSKKFPKNYANNMFGRLDMIKCDRDICIPHKIRTLIPKQYYPEIDEDTKVRAPILFYYNGEIYDLFAAEDIVKIFENNEIDIDEKKEDGIMEVYAKTVNGEHGYIPLLTTNTIFKIIELLEAEKLSILDFSCSAPCGQSTSTPSYRFELPPGVGFGSRRSKSRRKNKKYKRNKLIGTRKNKK